MYLVLSYLFVLTSVVDVPEGRVYELSEVSGLLRYVHQQWDGDVLPPVKVQQRFRQTSLPRGQLWKHDIKTENQSCSV